MEKKAIGTKMGEVLLVRDRTGEYVSSLEMGEGLGIFFHYRYEEAKKTREILSSICSLEGQMAVCASSGGSLVGYLTIVRIDPDSRWGSINDTLVRAAETLDDPVLLELGSIEISMLWRSMGLGGKLLKFAFEDPALEKKIVISRELSWTWDLKSTGLTAMGYRTMLLRLFEGAGFRYCSTDDEEISYSGESMLMARVGLEIPPEVALRFYRSLQRSEPRGWGWG